MGLVITRNDGQRIILTTKEGERISIEVNHERSYLSSRIKVYIEAPDSVVILREELLDKENNKENGDVT